MPRTIRQCRRRMRSRSERRRGRRAVGRLADGRRRDLRRVGRRRSLRRGRGRRGRRSRLDHRRLFPTETHDLVEPVRQTLRGRVLRVDVERLPGEGVGAAIVPPVERDPRQPDDRDRVARIGLGSLAVQPLGLLELADRQGSLGLRGSARSRLAHASSAMRDRASSSNVARSLSFGSTITRSRSSSRIRPSSGPWTHAELLHQVLPVDLRAGCGRGRPRRPARAPRVRAARPALRHRAAGRSRRCPPRAARTGRRSHRRRSCR